MKISEWIFRWISVFILKSSYHVKGILENQLCSGTSSEVNLSGVNLIFTKANTKKISLTCSSYFLSEKFRLISSTNTG